MYYFFSGTHYVQMHGLTDVL